MSCVVWSCDAACFNEKRYYAEEKAPRSFEWSLVSNFLVVAAVEEVVVAVVVVVVIVVVVEIGGGKGNC